MNGKLGFEKPTAVLYARVSTDEQARKGYSLAQQIEALREYAAREGYEILEEVVDPGQSGASLERPGMDRVRDLVAAGRVHAVLAQDRDRFSREPAYSYLLKREFEEHGTLLKSLNDRGDGSPEGELTDGILDQLAKFDRAKITERMRRGKLRKAREGKLVAGRFVRYGFKLNDSRDGYDLDEEKMVLMRRVFRMVGEEGKSIRAVAMTFDREGIPTPSGGRFWDRGTLRKWILDDAYLPHDFEEVRELVSTDVAAALDPGKRYGILWWGRRATKSKQISEIGPEGRRRYRKTYRSQIRPKSEQVPIPVPDSGIPPELIAAARDAVKHNAVPSSAGERHWELSGGLVRCGCCGRALRGRAHTKKSGGKDYRYFYYRCPAYDTRGREGCENSRGSGALKLERRVWEFVRGVMLDPEELRRDLNRMIEMELSEHRGDPKSDLRQLLKKLTEIEVERRGYLRQNARGVLTDSELDEMLSDLEETRQMTEQEVQSIKGRNERIEDMSRDRDALLDSYAELTPEALDSLTCKERHTFYKMLRLRVLVSRDGTLEVWIAAGPVHKAEGNGELAGKFFQSSEHIEVCPHGRPIVRRITLEELLKGFGR